VINSGRIKWAGYVTSMVGKKIIKDFGGKTRGKETTRKTKT
jgi:hypothetical protein